MDFLLHFSLVNTFLIVWILFWIGIFVLAYFETKIDSISIILGLILSYIILFPICRRILIFLTIDMGRLRSIEFAFLFLIILIILLIYTLIKHFTTFFKEKRIIKNFVLLMDTGYKAIFDFIIKFEFVETKFLFPVMTFLWTNVKTEEKKIYLYLIFNAVPKSIFFSSLFYDINVLQHLYYSLYGSIFLLFPVIFNFSFKMLQQYAQEGLEGLSVYLNTSLNYAFTKEQRKFFLASNLNPDNLSLFIITLKRPTLEYITDEWFTNEAVDVFCTQNSWAYWCDTTKEFFNNIIYFRFTVMFLVIQILCQITTIINQW